jgi:type I restriction enzyme R subunit
MVAMATGTARHAWRSPDLPPDEMGLAKRFSFVDWRRAAQAVGALAAYEPEPGLKFDKISEVYSQRFQREDFDEGEGPLFDPTVLPQEYLTNPDGRHAFVYVSTIQRMRINLFGMPEEWDPEGREDDASQIDIPIHFHRSSPTSATAVHRP